MLSSAAVPDDRPSPEEAGGDPPRRLARWLQQLALREDGADHFVSIDPPGTGKHLFGGLILAHAVLATSATVEEHHIHSLHAYFLRPGSSSAPIRYRVDRLRNGRHFSTRRLIAMQNDREIFTMMASFQGVEAGPAHQQAMPEAAQISAAAIESAPPLPVPGIASQHFIALRDATALFPTAAMPSRAQWVRSVAPLSAALLDDHALQAAMLAYVSDMFLFGVVIRGFDLPRHDKRIRMTSLDHAMWFYPPLRLSDWILYRQESPRSGHARGMAKGFMYHRSGDLMAVMSQEGLLRMPPIPPSP